MAIATAPSRVSWNNFQQPRWAAKDKPNIQETVEAGGGTYTDADANLDTEQQLTDIETFINQGADVLDPARTGQPGRSCRASRPAKAAGIPIIAYDRLIEDPELLYITFDNVGVGEAEASAMFEAVPEGTYVLIKGDPGDPNASIFLPQGWDKPASRTRSTPVTSRSSTISSPTRGTPRRRRTTWRRSSTPPMPRTSQIDAVLAENDSTALGVVAALQNKSYDTIPVSGQDGDTANLQNVAKGLQYVDVWKDANELGKVAGAAALQLCEGTAMADITLPDGTVNDAVAPEAGLTAAAVHDPRYRTVSRTTGDENEITSFILKPQPITQENLDLITDSGWLTQGRAMRGRRRGQRAGGLPVAA